MALLMMFTVNLKLNSNCVPYKVFCTYKEYNYGNKVFIFQHFFRVNFVAFCPGFNVDNVHWTCSIIVILPLPVKLEL